MKRLARHGILAGCALALRTGCADDPYQKTKIGATQRWRERSQAVGGAALSAVWLLHVLGR